MLRTAAVVTLLSTLTWACSSDTTESTSAGGTAGTGGATAQPDPPSGGTGGSFTSTGGGGDPGEQADVFDGLTRLVLGDDLCLPLELPPAGDDRVACTLVEVLWGSAACDCSQPGRGEVSEGTMTAIVDYEQQGGRCETLDCDDACGCTIEQLTGSELQSCLHDAEPDPSLSGFCVIDVQSAEQGNPDLVAHCPPIAQRTLRMVGETIPVENGVVYLDCRGE